MSPATLTRHLARHRRAEHAIAAAIHDLGAGRHREAATALGRLRPSPSLGAGHQSLIARVLTAAGAHAQALQWFDGALRGDKGHHEALVGRADVLALVGQSNAAVAAFETAFQAGVRDATAFYNYGCLLLQLDRTADALHAFDLALRLRPAYPAALRAAGRLLQAAGNVEGALHLFAEAIRHAPADVDAVLDRANLLRASDRLADALATYDEAIPRLPHHALVWTNRGTVLHDLGRMAEGLASLDQALHLDPDLPQAHLNRGMVLVRLNRQAEALAAFDRALALKPDYPEALSSRGLALKMLGRIDEAGADFDAALRIDPGFVYALANRGELNLLLGRYAAGWPEYEQRFFTERQHKPALKGPVPEWRGPDHAVRRLAVFADQGAGDCLHFSRFLPAVRALVPDVTLICRPRLHRVLAAVTTGLTVTDQVADEAAFDAQVTLSSLPSAFQVDAASLATSRPYLCAEPELVRHWAARIGSEGIKVGLCWRGGQDWQCDPGRSVPFAALAPLAGIAGLRLFSLQMPDNDERDAAASLQVDDLGRELDAGADGFIDTAAVMAGLDLILTCDTSIAHLAGALGRPVWVLLQAVPEWRWLLGRDDSPWYPSARLFRQTRAGDWREPIAAVTAALRAWSA